MANGIQSEKHLYIKHNEEENILFRHNKEFSAFTLWSPQCTEKGLAEQLSGSKTGEHTLSPNDFSQAISEDHCQSSFQEDFKECNCLLNETNSKELEEFYSYKGNNRLHLTGVNAHRKDVVFKTLVRSIRRYLWFVFSKMYNIKLLGKFKKSKVFKEFVCDFYQKNIKCNSKTALTLSSDEEEGVCFYIGTMMTKDHLFPDDKASKNSERIRIHKMFNEITKSFSVCKFQKFFTPRAGRNSVKILQESGIIAKIIALYKPLSSLKERYEQAVEILIDPSDKNLNLFDN